MPSDNQTIARPYAKAAFEFACEHQKISDWSRALNFAAEVANNADVASLLSNPEVGQAEIGDWLIQLKPEWFSEDLQNFIRILAQNNRLPVLVDISALFEIHRNEFEKRLDVEVVSPMSLSQKQLDDITVALKTRLKREIQIKPVIDQSLIGGVLIQAGDLVIDGSVRGQLQKLSQELAG